jgi:hypothetical protein
MPQLVSETTLQAMRALREENMLFLCDFQEETFVPDGDGGGVGTWTPVEGLTDVPCSAVAMNGDETIAAQQIAPASNTFVYVPWSLGAKIKAKYRVVVRGSIGEEDFAETYGIVYIAVPKTFSVQTTIYARSGMAASGAPPTLMLAGRRAAADSNVPMTDAEHLASLGLGNVNPHVQGE